jgi:hypothetical protein
MKVERYDHLCLIPFSFELPGHVAQRTWAAYVIVTVLLDGSRKIYVGKVGDNRVGCNPVISRIGNHLSFNRIHAQLRNKHAITNNARYVIHYETFGAYYEDEHKIGLSKINEVERQLNMPFRRGLRRTC